MSSTVVLPSETSSSKVADGSSGEFVDDDETLSSGRLGEEEFEEPPRSVALLTYFGYAVLSAYGHLRDLLRKLGIEKTAQAKDSQGLEAQGFSPLYNDFNAFYTRNLYRRIQDVFNRPISGVPGRNLNMYERDTDNGMWSLYPTGKMKKLLNMGSYNYLGFAENTGICADEANRIIKEHGVAMSSNRNELGTTEIHLELEKVVAEFVGKEAALVFGMGFATNSTNIPALVGKGGLIVSDRLNHASLALGCKLAGAKVVSFRHNDMAHLEHIVRRAIVDGQPKSHRPWTKIVILVEGIYSMEGSIVKLRDVIRIKKKYGCYLYIDEAHSIGALGKNGRGAAEYFNVDPNDIDIMMGTFTKSFGAAGGYISSSKDVIEHLRHHSHSWFYSASMALPVAAQTLTALRLIRGDVGGDNGVRRIKQLKSNSRLMRQELKRLGFIVFGNDDSPIIPMLLYNPAKIASFSRECLKRGVGVVVVGYPATSIIESRARFCVSASHTREDILRCIEVIDEVGTLLGLHYSQKKRN